MSILRVRRRRWELNEQRPRNGARYEERFSELKDISQPTLVVNGHHDVMIPTINSYTLSQHIPRAQLIIYPDSGHGVLFQFPELFVAHGRMFLEGS